MQVGAIRKWEAPEPITVINGVGDNVNRHGRTRLILDTRYISLFDRYSSFSYEKFGDLPRYLEQQDHMSLTDFKSGYLQLRMYINTFRFLGTEFAGQVHHFAALPFGLSSACHTYTRLIAEVYRPLRLKGQRMTFPIDDAAFVFASKPVAKFQVNGGAENIDSAGLSLSLKKCMLVPIESGSFLGLFVSIECVQV